MDPNSDVLGPHPSLRIVGIQHIVSMPRAGAESPRGNGRGADGRTEFLATLFGPAFRTFNAQGLARNING
jgi:hypothetical protein